MTAAAAAVVRTFKTYRLPPSPTFADHSNPRSFRTDNRLSSENHKRFSFRFFFFFRNRVFELFTIFVSSSVSRRLEKLGDYTGQVSRFGRRHVTKRPRSVDHTRAQVTCSTQLDVDENAPRERLPPRRAVPRVRPLTVHNRNEQRCCFRCSSIVDAYSSTVKRALIINVKFDTGQRVEYGQTIRDTTQICVQFPVEIVFFALK